MMLYEELTYYLHFLHLLNMSCTSLLIQHAAFCLHFPFTNLDDFIAESCCNFFKSLVSCFTVDSVSNDCQFTAPTCIFNDVENRLPSCSQGKGWCKVKLTGNRNMR